MIPAGIPHGSANVQMQKLSTVRKFHFSLPFRSTGHFAMIEAAQTVNEEIQKFTARLA